jgi:hypothetical protein
MGMGARWVIQVPMCVIMKSTASPQRKELGTRLEVNDQTGRISLDHFPHSDSLGPSTNCPNDAQSLSATFVSKQKATQTLA